MRYAVQALQDGNIHALVTTTWDDEDDAEDHAAWLIASRYATRTVIYAVPDEETA